MNVMRFIEGWRNKMREQGIKGTGPFDGFPSISIDSRDRMCPPLTPVVVRWKSDAITLNKRRLEGTILAEHTNAIPENGMPEGEPSWPRVLNGKPWGGGTILDRVGNLDSLVTSYKRAVDKACEGVGKGSTIVINKERNHGDLTSAGQILAADISHEDRAEMYASIKRHADANGFRETASLNILEQSWNYVLGQIVDRIHANGMLAGIYAPYRMSEHQVKLFDVRVVSGGLFHNAQGSRGLSDFADLETMVRRDLGIAQALGQKMAVVIYPYLRGGHDRAGQLVTYQDMLGSANAILQALWHYPDMYDKTELMLWCGAGEAEIDMASAAAKIWSEISGEVKGWDNG